MARPKKIPLMPKLIPTTARHELRSSCGAASLRGRVRTNDSSIDHMDVKDSRFQNGDSAAQFYPDWITRQPRKHVAAAASFLYATAVIASMQLANLTLNVSTVWLPADIGLVSVLLWGYWLLPILMLVQVGGMTAAAWLCRNRLKIL